MSISKIWRQVLPLSVIRNVKEVYTSILYPNCLYIAGHICTLLRQNLFRLARFLKFRDTQHRWIRCEWPLCFGIWATILYYFGPVRHRSNFCNRGHRGTVIVNPRIVSIPYHHAGRPNGWKIHWLTRGCFSYPPPPPDFRDFAQFYVHLADPGMFSDYPPSEFPRFRGNFVHTSTVVSHGIWCIARSLAYRFCFGRQSGLLGEKWKQGWKKTVLPLPYRSAHSSRADTKMTIGGTTIEHAEHSLGCWGYRRCVS